MTSPFQTNDSVEDRAVHLCQSWAFGSIRVICCPGSEHAELHCGPKTACFLGRQFVIRALQDWVLPLLCPLLNLLLRDPPFTSTMIPVLFTSGPLHVLVLLLETPTTLAMASFKFQEADVCDGPAALWQVSPHAPM